MSLQTLMATNLSCWDILVCGGPTDRHCHAACHSGPMMSNSRPSSCAQAILWVESDMFTWCICRRCFVNQLWRVFVSFRSKCCFVIAKKRWPMLCPAGLCTLATVCCYLAGMDLLHRVSMLPDKVDGSLGWSLYLALMSSPLHMMAAALLVWAARSHSQNYYRMSAYRVA